jgi:hypothetical protein
LGKKCKHLAFGSKDSMGSPGPTLHEMLTDNFSQVASFTFLVCVAVGIIVLVAASLSFRNLLYKKPNSSSDIAMTMPNKVEVISDLSQMVSTTTSPVSLLSEAVKNHPIKLALLITFIVLLVAGGTLAGVLLTRASHVSVHNEQQQVEVVKVTADEQGRGEFWGLLLFRFSFT